MRKIFHLSAIALFTLTSCNPLDKSIIQDLSVEEIKSASEKDSLFEKTYNIVELFKMANEDNKLALAKYSELTYQRLLDYSNYSADPTIWEKYETQYGVAWSKEHLRSHNKAKNLIKDWRKKKEAFDKENDPAQYVKIELVGISTDYYRYAGGVKSVYFKFRITPLKGRVDQVVWSINPTAKIHGEPDKSGVSWIIDTQRYIYSSPFSSAVTGEYKASYDHEKKASGETSKAFLRDYFLNLELKKVRYKGKNYEPDGFDFPWEVEQYIEYEDKGDDGMMDYYLKKIIKSDIDSTYVSKSDFVFEKKEEVKKEAYPLAHEFAVNFFSLTLENGSDDLIKKFQKLLEE